MTNAVKFTGDGGSVVVRADRGPSEIRITVTDTGIGVPEADRERIFESFQQGGRGASREEGTGLGLTLSRRIVELLGGEMWLESEVGVGSTFGFSIPAPELEAAEVGVGGRTEQTGKVVVVEDDRASLDLLTAYLSGADLEVTTARDGPSGLAAVRRVRPTAVLLDIRLPGIDGWAVLKALKADPNTAGIPVIVVSIVEERTRGAALGAAAYLVKPLSRNDLLSALTVGGSAARDEHPRAGQRGGAVTPGRILVVEDNPKNLKLVRDVLQYSGYEVVEATTGEDGVRLAHEVHPDLILMDLQLPGIDGAEALRRIRKSDPTHEVPVVAVTAFAMDDDRRAAFDSGFNGYVEKPISVRSLPQQVRDFLELGGTT